MRLLLVTVLDSEMLWAQSAAQEIQFIMQYHEMPPTYLLPTIGPELRPPDYIVYAVTVPLVPRYMT